MSSQSFSSYSLPGLLLQLHVHTVVLSLGIREICLPKFHTLVVVILIKKTIVIVKLVICYTIIYKMKLIYCYVCEWTR